MIVHRVPNQSHTIAAPYPTCVCTILALTGAMAHAIRWHRAIYFRQMKQWMETTVGIT